MPKNLSRKPKSKLAEKKITSDTRTALLKSLTGRLSSGKCLTAAQLKWLKDYERGESKAPGEGLEPDTDTALGRQLGVSRQCVTWHRNRADAPKNRNVGEWQNYLLACGRSLTVERVEAAKDKPPIPGMDVETALLGQFHELSNDLHPALATAAKHVGLNLPPAQLDRLAFASWLILAGTAQRHACACGLRGVLDGDADGAAYPAGIKGLCARLTEGVAEPKRKPLGDLADEIIAARAENFKTPENQPQKTKLT